MKKEQRKITNFEIYCECDRKFDKSYVKIQHNLNPYEQKFIEDLKFICDVKTMLSDDEYIFQKRVDEVMEFIDNEEDRIYDLKKCDIDVAIKTIEQEIVKITAEEIKKPQDFGGLYASQISNLKNLAQQYFAINNWLNNFKLPVGDKEEEKERRMVYKIFKKDEDYMLKRILRSILIFELKFDLPLSHFDISVANQVFEELHMELVNNKYKTDKQRVNELGKINRGF